MSTEHQARLVGELDGTTVQFETSGRTFRPALRLPDALVDECKLRLTADGLSITAVDAANVGMIDLRVLPAAFTAFDREDDLTTGLPLDDWTSVLETARVGRSTDDAIACRVTDGSLTTTVTRDYDDTTVEQTSETLTIDPNSIREEPNVPDLDLTAEATVSARSLRAVCDQVDAVGDHVSVFPEDGDMVWGTRSGDATGRFGALARFSDALTGEPESDRPQSLYTLDYLSDMTSALVGAKVDSVMVRWHDDFPIKLLFERTDEDGTTLYEGQYMLAPRLDSRDDLPGGDDE